VLVAPLGRLILILRLSIRDGHIVGIEAVADPVRLARLELTMLDAG
jgi:hypothetical protein